MFSLHQEDDEPTIRNAPDTRAEVIALMHDVCDRARRLADRIEAKRAAAAKVQP